MKKYKLSILLAVGALIFILANGTSVLSVHAAAEFNLIATVSAKKAPVGKWEKDSCGYRYRYKNGKYAKSVWIKVKGKIFYIGSKGYRLSGVKTFKKQRYYLDRKGVLTTGWQNIGTNRYYFSKKTGAAQTEWATINKKTYYFNQAAELQTNQWISGYYVGTKGYILKNTWIGEDYVGEDGKKVDPDPNLLSKTIFVGDSRTVGLKAAIGGKNIYIGKIGEGYSWFSSSAIVKLESRLKAYPTSKVVLNFGINDLGNIDDYISIYEKLIESYPHTKFYLMSVNPVEAKRAKDFGYSTRTVNNTNIKKFNAKMKASFPELYLDSYSYLVENGYIKNVLAGKGTIDGIHYTEAVSKAIYDYAKSQME